MLSSFAMEFVRQAEKDAASGRIEEAFSTLRKIPLADFCELCLQVPEGAPKLREIMPRLPSAEVQKRWVGDHGRPLMLRSCGLIRLFEVLSWRHRGRSLEDAKVLDYGCGFGRLLRLLGHRTQARNIYGLDPMPESLRLCEEGGVRANLALIDPKPTALPFGDTLFDFVFSFSVFTHVPLQIAEAILKAVRARIAPDGIFAVTVRSHEFWDLRRSVWNADKVDALIRDHHREGYAFIPLETTGLKSEDYGDTTFSRERFEQLCRACGWKVVDIDRDMSEPFQIVVALAPAHA